jgi:MoaA/NifB/PqqE/SkfB family radical SAM enzyme
MSELAPSNIGELKNNLKRLARRLRRSFIATNSEFFINHFEYAYKPARAAPCFAGYLFVDIIPSGEVNPCYIYRTGLNVREAPLDEIIGSEEFAGQRREVTRCDAPCMMTGCLETSLRCRLSYLLFHPMEIYKQAKMHL